MSNGEMTPEGYAARVLGRIKGKDIDKNRSVDFTHVDTLFNRSWLIDDRWHNDPGVGSYYTSQESKTKYSGVMFACPGCGEVTSCDFDSYGCRWKWDGNEERPTLTPSIFHKDPECGWHGFLTAGRFHV